MAISHTTTITEAGVRATITQSAENEIDQEFIVTAGQDDKQVNISFATARLKSLLITATGLDDDETLTVKGNDTSGFGGSWTLTAPGCLQFMGATNNPWAANPFTADITNMYFSNNSDENNATIRVTGLSDPTP
jgi:hypothetical protein